MHGARKQVAGLTEGNDRAAARDHRDAERIERQILVTSAEQQHDRHPAERDASGELERVRFVLFTVLGVFARNLAGASALNVTVRRNGKSENLSAALR